MEPERVRVWDLPTRIFHWLLAVLVVFSFVSAKVGGSWTEWHFRSGYAILTLLLFRLLWGFAGNRNARFASFVRGPRAINRYLHGRLDPDHGHDPLGGWSVVTMLAVLFVQAAAGLFANDAIASEGPLAKLVSAAASERLTTLHRWGEKLLIALVLLHLGAVGFFELVRGMMRPMCAPCSVITAARCLYASSGLANCAWTGAASNAAAAVKAIRVDTAKSPWGLNGNQSSTSASTWKRSGTPWPSSAGGSSDSTCSAGAERTTTHPPACRTLMPGARDRPPCRRSRPESTPAVHRAPRSGSQVPAQTRAARRA